ncbi:MAG: FecR domain-containing protein [Proteobacteria bacterium]|nr:FecR domain-containing protein [Pseudomonadota bacterium]
MNTQIYEEATEWLVKHRDGGLGPAEKERFDAWLRESPQHVRAYLEMSAIWEDVPALGPDWNPEAEQLLDDARSEVNISSLVGKGRSDRKAVQARLSPSREGGDRRASRWRAPALAAMLVIAVGSVATWYTFFRNTYSTDIGEQRSIILADGSTLDLNSRSRVRVRYSEKQRDLDLVEGQALFRVAHNAARPFVVHSGATRVLAVGTQFDVYRKGAATVVTVVEGRVEVSADRSAAGPSGAAATLPPTEESSSTGANGILLAAGEQLSVPAGNSASEQTAAAAVHAANVATATAWTQHNLVFDSSPLTEVADEFNRYNKRRLVITALDVGNMRISGRFSSADPTLFLKFLRAQPELRVEETDSEIRIGKR